MSSVVVPEAAWQTSSEIFIQYSDRGKPLMAIAVLQLARSLLLAQLRKLGSASANDVPTHASQKLFAGHHTCIWI